MDPRPLVLTGADLPGLLGAGVTDPVCYTYQDAAWTPCPLQIDERDVLDPGAAYPPDVLDAPDLFGGVPQLVYTSPQDYPTAGFDPIVPADADPTFDADDELVLMVRFFGDVVDPVVTPPPFSPEDVTRIEVNGRYVFVYVPTAPLDQAGGIDLVSYTFDLLAGTFPDDYNFNGDGSLRDVIGDFLGANPEYSVFESAYYKTSFEDRWIQRELFLATPAGDGNSRVATYGNDLLDRVKFGTRPDRMGKNPNCSRSIYTGSTRRGTLGIQKDGPIRALRIVQGSNSGGLNRAVYKMYERSMIYDIRHQMHGTPGTTLFFDYAPTVAGMEHYSNLFPDGVPVDGVPDRPAGDYYEEAYMEWDYLLGPQGTLVSRHAFETNIPQPYPYSYYEDNTTPEVQQCTGDAAAYASNGNVYFFGRNVGGSVPWTDPGDSRSFADGELRVMKFSRAVTLDGTPRTKAEADALRNTLSSEPQPTVALVESGGSIPVELTGFDAVLDGKEVVLRWTTASETINAGFAVERAVAGEGFEELTFVPGAGTTSEAQAYVWRDALLPFEATTVRYRLRQVDFDGSFAYAPTVEVAQSQPEGVLLQAPFPNPTAGGAVVRYEVARSGPLRLEVFDALGRRVAVLAEGEHEAGRYEVDWTAGKLAGGVYQVRLESASLVETRPLVVVR